MFPYTVIDLTHTLNSDIPTWEGDCGFHQDMTTDYADCDTEPPFRIMKLRMHAGMGTHMDAPSHCFPGARCIHDFHVTELCMPCVVIDVSAQSHERYLLEPRDILDFEKQHGLIATDSCVMIKTGWEKFWHQPEKYRNNLVFPSVSHEAAHLLLERGISALGIDTPSPDRPENGFHVHRAFLSAGKILMENVAHLDHMPIVGSFIMAMPMKIQDGTEAPMRLVGLVARDKIEKRLHGASHKIMT